MSAEKLMNAMGEIEYEMLNEALRREKRRKVFWMIMLLCFVVVLSVFSAGKAAKKKTADLYRSYAAQKLQGSVIAALSEADHCFREENPTPDILRRIAEIFMRVDEACRVLKPIYEPESPGFSLGYGVWFDAAEQLRSLADRIDPLEVSFEIGSLKDLMVIVRKYLPLINECSDGTEFQKLLSELETAIKWW